MTELIIVRITTSKSKNSESFYIAQSYTNANGKCTSKTVRKLGTLAELSAQLHTDCDGVVEWANEFPETFQPCHPIFFLFIRRLYSLSLSTMYLVSSFSFALQNRTPGLTYIRHKYYAQWKEYSQAILIGKSRGLPVRNSKKLPQKHTDILHRLCSCESFFLLFFLQLSIASYIA